MENTLIIWIAISILCLGIDIVTSSFLFVWFTIGGIGAIIAYVVGEPLFIQIIVFIILSLLCMVIGYPIIKKTIKKTVPKTPTMEESYIGRTMVSNQDIIIDGRIKIDGIYWGVINKGNPIKQGDKFKIVQIKGNKLVINKM